MIAARTAAKDKPSCQYVEEDRADGDTTANAIVALIPESIPQMRGFGSEYRKFVLNTQTEFDSSISRGRRRSISSPTASLLAITTRLSAIRELIELSSSSNSLRLASLLAL
jgi:hypothetical protein